ncbi:MAG: biopolymer transporter ExbD [Pseudomonadota bacterium]
MPQSNSISLGEARPRRKPSLTPMIDVVFLLLVFFMLAARFGLDTAIPLSPAVQGGGTYTGAPRLITISPDGLRLNGVATDPDLLAEQVLELMPDEDAIVVLRAVDGADLQAVINVMDSLSENGIERLVLAE